MLTSKEIREQFLQFFKDKMHTIVKSSPSIPIDDPTLLFTNAGMNQFKDIFIGKVEPKFKRVANSQKCIRAGGKHNDLEEVGKDGYHHTFFEMLGNWSFADYYKKEAIQWSWELLTEVWKLPKEKLYATCHHTDQEAFELWKKVTDIDPNHIMYFGDKDNFWEMGETGPCGPCSEIHIDLGEDRCDMKNIEGHVCGVNGDCGRFIELWNLVFMQFYREEDKSLTPLKNKYVDTGAGFERICQVLQNVTSNYETDLFTPIISKIADISGKVYTYETGTAHRVIADHIRCLSFAIADGGLPSNEGRGYVLRRILRRASRFGRLLDLKKPFLSELVDTVAEVMGHHYLELNEKKSHIKLIINSEEERFNNTLDKGLEKFEEIVNSLEGKEISGKDAFTLYDTFGFPFDLTSLIAEEKGLTVDEKGFEAEMEKQRNRARNASNFKMETENIEWHIFSEGETIFTGYENIQNKVKIRKYAYSKDDTILIQLDKTPFYAEQGGQIADKGKIYNDTTILNVLDVKKDYGTIIHHCKLEKGNIDNNEYMAEIEAEYRKDIARNHTATHILHASLRNILGDHAQQKGSLVTADYLRFDFTHFKNTEPNELKLVEEKVNDIIRNCMEINTEIKDIEEARKSGAMALFGEKYDEKVRVVSVGDFSKELCGGTHLKYSGEIGFFKILSESSVAAGVRRIEAITGKKAEEYVQKLEKNESEIASLLSVPKKMIVDKIQKILNENKEIKSELEKQKANSQASSINDILKEAKKVNDVNVIAKRISAESTNDLKTIGDLVKEKLPEGIAVFASEINGKVSIITIVTGNLKKKYPAGKIVGKVAEIVGGRGGGRPDMAMAGGKEIAKIDEAIAKVYSIIEEF